MQAPRALPRAIRLPQAIAGEAEYAFVFLSSILHAHMDELFSGMKVQGCYQFRVTRNSDLFVEEEEIKNLHTALQGELFHRHFGDAVRLEVADNCSQRMVEFLLQQFGLREADLYRVEGPVNLYRLREVPDQVERPEVKYPPFQPGLPPALDTGSQLVIRTCGCGDQHQFIDPALLLVLSLVHIGLEQTQKHALDRGLSAFPEIELGATKHRH